MAIVLVESILLSLGGGLLGMLLAHTMIGLISPYVESQTGVSLGPVSVRSQRNDIDTGASRAGVTGRIFAGDVGLPDRRGESTRRQPVNLLSKVLERDEPC